MADILARLFFVLWILSGMIMLGFALAGQEVVAFYFGVAFLTPIVLSLAYVCIKWIITGKSE